jgi:hypothetical protein
MSLFASSRKMAVQCRLGRSILLYCPHHVGILCTNGSTPPRSCRLLTNAFSRGRMFLSWHGCPMRSRFRSFWQPPSSLSAGHASMGFCGGYRGVWCAQYSSAGPPIGAAGAVCPLLPHALSATTTRPTSASTRTTIIKMREGNESTQPGDHRRNLQPVEYNGKRCPLRGRVRVQAQCQQHPAADCQHDPPASHPTLSQREQKE